MKVNIQIELKDNLNCVQDYLDTLKVSEEVAKKAFELAFYDLVKKNVSSLYDIKVNAEFNDD